MQCSAVLGVLLAVIMAVVWWGITIVIYVEVTLMIEAMVLICSVVGMVLVGRVW